MRALDGKLNIKLEWPNSDIITMTVVTDSNVMRDCEAA